MSVGNRTPRHKELPPSSDGLLGLSLAMHMISLDESLSMKYVSQSTKEMIAAGGGFVQCGRLGNVRSNERSLGPNRVGRVEPHDRVSTDHLFLTLRRAAKSWIRLVSSSVGGSPPTWYRATICGGLAREGRRREWQIQASLPAPSQLPRSDR